MAKKIIGEMSRLVGLWYSVTRQIKWEIKKCDTCAVEVILKQELIDGQDNTGSSISVQQHYIEHTRN